MFTSIAHSLRNSRYTFHSLELGAPGTPGPGLSIQQRGSFSGTEIRSYTSFGSFPLSLVCHISLCPLKYDRVTEFTVVDANCQDLETVAVN